MRDEDDRRRVGLSLTQEGERLLKRVRARRTTWLVDRLRGLEADEVEAIEAGSSRSEGSCDGSAPLALNARTFASLKRHRNYRLFFTGQVISVSGTWIRTLRSRGSWSRPTHSPLAVGILAFCRFIPFTVFGLVAGVVADRIDNRKL